jgi:hypothetical protein
MRPRWLVRSVVVAVFLAAGPPVLGADPRYPDWPCVQAKVPEISAAAVWAGPPLDDAEKGWERDQRVRDLIARLAPRRVAIEDAKKLIADFVTGDTAEREEKGKLLFAGLLQRLNRERTDVMSGIERLARRHKELAETIRSDIAELHTLQDAPDPDEAKLRELASRVEWSKRIFEDRLKTLRYVCEVPTLIEQRLFALGRTVQEAME